MKAANLISRMVCSRSTVVPGETRSGPQGRPSTVLWRARWSCFGLVESCPIRRPCPASRVRPGSSPARMLKKESWGPKIILGRRISDTSPLETSSWRGTLPLPERPGVYPGGHRPSRPPGERRIFQFAPQQRLYLRPLPQGHGSLRPTFFPAGALTGLVGCRRAFQKSCMPLMA